MTEKAKSGQTDSSSAGKGTGNDKPTLDDLLASYKQGDGRSKDAAPESDDDVKKLTDKLSRLEQELANRDYQDTFAKRVIPVVKGDLDAKDEYVEWWVNKRATEDERLRAVWDEKDSNPSKFRTTMEALADEFAKEHASDSDKDRVANAVRNARKSDAPQTSFDDVEWASLSQDQFELKKRALYKAAERGELR